MAIPGLITAALNVLVTLTASEQFWLLYTTFLDLPLIVIGVWVVIYQAAAKGETGAQETL